jgi:hypothetical protein
MATHEIILTFCNYNLDASEKMDKIKKLTPDIEWDFRGCFMDTCAMAAQVPLHLTENFYYDLLKEK